MATNKVVYSGRTLPSFVMGGKAGKNLISGYGIAGQVDQCLSTIDYFVNSHILSSSLLEIKKKNGFTLCPLATHLYLPA